MVEHSQNQGLLAEAVTVTHVPDHHCRPVGGVQAVEPALDEARGATKGAIW